MNSLKAYIYPTRLHNYPHFTDEKTDVQRGKVTWQSYKSSNILLILECKLFLQVPNLWSQKWNWEFWTEAEWASNVCLTKHISIVRYLITSFTEAWLIWWADAVIERPLFFYFLIILPVSRSFMYILKTGGKLEMYRYILKLSSY